MKTRFGVLVLTTLGFAIPCSLVAQSTPVGVEVDVPNVPTVVGEDAAAGMAADMIQTILAGQDDPVMWDALAATLEERTRDEPVPESSALERSVAFAGEWAGGVIGAVRGTHPWSLERAVGVLIGLLLAVAVVSSLVGAARRTSIRIPHRRRRPPAARDAVQLAKRLDARRV